MDMTTTANADMSSKMQRIQTATIELEQFDRVLASGGNPLPIIKNYFDAIGSTLGDQIFPEQGQMTPEEEAQLKAMTQAQEQANKLQELQLQILEREQIRLDKDTDAKIAKVGDEIKKIQSEFIQNISKALLNAEQAETEDVKNQISIYSTNIQSQIDVLEAIGASNDRNIAASTALQTIPNIPRTVQ